MKVFKILLMLSGIGILTGIKLLSVTARAEEQALTLSGLARTWQLGPELDISGATPATYEEGTAIAHNGSHYEYLVVWFNNRPVTQDIYARRVSDSGQLLSWFAVSSASNCTYPAVAYNRTNDQYLVVWSQYSSTDTRWEIYGRIIDWNAPGSRTPFLIASLANMDLETPELAWNSYRNEYLVTWQTSLVTTSQLLGIGRRRLSNSGSFLSNADYITGEGTTNQGSPDISYNLAADGYLVVWVEPGASAINVHAGRLNREGTLQGSKFALEPSVFEQQKPALTTNEQDIYFVVWQVFANGDWDIYGREVNSATGAIIPIQYLFAIKYNIDETAPDIVCNPLTPEYLVAWQQSSTSGETIQAVRWGTGVNAYSFEVVPGGMGDNKNPAVALDSPGYLVAYDWKSWTPGSDSEIYGRLWWPERIYLPILLR
jgi:hypothetical protein